MNLYLFREFLLCSIITYMETVFVVSVLFYMSIDYSQSEESYHRIKLRKLEKRISHTVVYMYIRVMVAV